MLASAIDQGKTRKKTEKKIQVHALQSQQRYFFQDFSHIYLLFFLTSFTRPLLAPNFNKKAPPVNGPSRPNCTFLTNFFFFLFSAPRSTSDPASSSILHHLGPLPLPPPPLVPVWFGSPIIFSSVSLASRCSHILSYPSTPSHPLLPPSFPPTPNPPTILILLHLPSWSRPLSLCVGYGPAIGFVCPFYRPLSVVQASTPCPSCAFSRPENVEALCAASASVNFSSASGLHPP